MSKLFPIRWYAALICVLSLLAFPGIATAQSRCPLGGGVRSFTSGEGMKPVGVHVPSGWTGEQRAPLVILLHGSTGTGAEMLRDSKLAETADRHGFLVAFPDGGIPAKQGFVWNIPDVPTVEGRIPGPGDRDDVAYLTGMIDALVAAGCVDASRVYVTGLSGGGRMTSWLGCVAPERFAAIAPVVGLRAGNPLRSDRSRPDPRTCRPDKPVSVIAFSGADDGTNPISGGGAGYWQYPMHAAEQRWAQLNGCQNAPTTRWVTPKVYEERYDGCRAGTEVVSRVSVGEGHHWVADNEALWSLLSQHRIEE
jgi:polyhydroxybutyrate depolymerase